MDGGELLTFYFFYFALHRRKYHVVLSIRGVTVRVMIAADGRSYAGSDIMRMPHQR
jgi:hypothetical protein